MALEKRRKLTLAVLKECELMANTKKLVHIKI
jgi:hypothetical protein